MCAYGHETAFGNMTPALSPTVNPRWIATRPSARILLLAPLGGFVGFAPGLVKLHEPLTRQFQVVAIGDSNSVFSGEHALIAFEQQRFGLGVFLLSREARASRLAARNRRQSSGWTFFSPSRASRARGSLSANLSRSDACEPAPWPWQGPALPPASVRPRERSLAAIASRCCSEDTARNSFRGAAIIPSSIHPVGSRPLKKGPCHAERPAPQSLHCAPELRAAERLRAPGRSEASAVSC